MKKFVLGRYGGRCACCGEKHLDFLNIDHVNNDGAEHRRETKNQQLSGAGMYRWLKRREYPTGFQVLCFNCNVSKHINRGICIHQIEAGS